MHQYSNVKFLYFFLHAAYMHRKVMGQLETTTSLFPTHESYRSYSFARLGRGLLSSLSLLNCSQIFEMGNILNPEHLEYGLLWNEMQTGWMKNHETKPRTRSKTMSCACEMGSGTFRLLLSRHGLPSAEFHEKVTYLKIRSKTNNAMPVFKKHTQWVLITIVMKSTLY